MATTNTDLAVTGGKRNITLQTEAHTRDIQADIEHFPSTCSKLAADVNFDAGICG